MIKINLVGEGKRATAAKAKKGRTLPTLPTGVGGENAALYSLLGMALVGVLFVALAPPIPGVWSGGWFWLNRTINSNEEQIAAAQRRVDELREVLEQVEAFKRKEAELELKIEVITDLKNNQKGPVRIMEELSEGLPELLWIDRLALQGNQVTLNGRAFSLNAVASLTESIAEVPEFFEPSLIDSTRQGPYYTYSLNFTFRPEAVAAGGALEESDADDGGLEVEEEF